MITYLDPKQPRRHDVDWLRVIAFLLLIFYHIGLYYAAGWGWHIKSVYQNEFIQYLMLLVNQWRIPLIFFVSGLALSLVEPRVSAIQLFKVRFLRLFVPLIFGIYLIVPPQIYYELVFRFDYPERFWQFWLEYIQPNNDLLPRKNHSAIGSVALNHVWYLAYLWFYTLIYLLLRPLLIRGGQIFCQRSVSVVVIFLLPIAIMTLFGVWLKPIYPKTLSLLGDWYSHSIYFSVFLFGYFIAKSERSWSGIIHRRRYWLLGGITSYVGLILLSRTILLKLDGTIGQVINQTWQYTNTWCWLLAAVGYAGAYLNKPSSTLTHLNDAILPWYILHQTVIIVLAFHLSFFALGGILEPMILIGGTFVICIVLYLLIRRFNPMRFIFGMKLLGLNTSK